MTLHSMVYYVTMDISLVTQDVLNVKNLVNQVHVNDSSSRNAKRISNLLKMACSFAASHFSLGNFEFGRDLAQLLYIDSG